MARTKKQLGPEEIKRLENEAIQAQKDYAQFEEVSREQVAEAKERLAELQRVTAINRRAMSANRKRAFNALKEQGYTYRDIAQIVGITQQAVYGFMTRP